MGRKVSNEKTNKWVNVENNFNDWIDVASIQRVAPLWPHKIAEK